jgi:hypothetical protein
MSAKNRVTDFVDKLFAKYDEHRMKQVARSWCLVSRDECKLRLRTVMALSIELDRIKRVDIFSTGIAESMIEDVIEGDWAMVSRLIGSFMFEREDVGDEIKKLWEPFVILLRAACVEEESLARLEEKGAEPS